MYKIHRNKFYVNNSFKNFILAVLLLITVCYGFMQNSLLNSTQVKLIDNIDVNRFKSTINMSLPIIDTIYNSGNMSVSLSSEIRGLINNIFSFSLDEPLTLLNAQIPLFCNYYNENLRQSIEKKFNDDINKEEIQQKQEEALLKNDASSINYEEWNENRVRKSTGVISDGKIIINNETKYKIDIEKLLNEPLNIELNKEGPKVLIYHTHTTESYLKDLSLLKSKKVTNRTQDPRYNVVRVGEELANNLRKKYGIEVIHNGTIHDYPNYNSSYSNSYKTIDKILKSYPSIKVVLDIHRDALGNNGEKLRTSYKTKDKNAAQVMFVVGSDQYGLEHSKWRENLKFALKLQKKLNEQCSGITRPIDLSIYRYNQHVTNGAIIIEIGGDGNTLSESLESTKYLAKAISDVVK